MYALIPNKDTLFALSSFQKKFIASNSAPENILFPEYPLWAFTELPLTEYEFVSCKIEAPEYDTQTEKFFIPVVIKYTNSSNKVTKVSCSNNFELQNHTLSETLRIYFASGKHAVSFITPSAEFISSPQNVFQTAEVFKNKNFWKQIKLKWIKIK